MKLNNDVWEVVLLVHDAKSNGRNVSPPARHHTTNPRNSITRF